MNRRIGCSCGGGDPGLGHSGFAERVRYLRDVRGHAVRPLDDLSRSNEDEVIGASLVSLCWWGGRSLVFGVVFLFFCFFVGFFLCLWFLFFFFGCFVFAGFC